MMEIRNDENLKCVLCEEKELETLIIKGESMLIRCVYCGLIYWFPLKSENILLEQIKKTYDNYSLYDYEKLDLAKKKIFIQYLKEICKKIDKGSLLDVGCGDGFFLELAEKFGFDVTGIEISEQAIYYAKNKRPAIYKKIYKGAFKDIKFPDNYFDVITLWDVFMLFNSPDKEIKEIYRILKKDGLLVMRIKNADLHLWLYKFSNIVEKIVRKPFIFLPYNYTNKSIKMFLQKHNFKDIKVLNSKLTHSDPYRQSKIGEGLRYLKEIYYCLSQLVYLLSFGKITISSSLIVYAKK